MIGGEQSFSGGGYYGTPVADALPIELLPKIGEDDHAVTTDEFKPHLTDDGLRHPITQLRFERRDNLARWNSLPPLEGANLIAGPKPGATVLMEHPALRGRNAVRWLIRDPELEYLHVDADQAVYKKGVAPRLHARLVDKDYRPYANAEVTLEVEGGTRSGLPSGGRSEAQPPDRPSAPAKGQPAPKPVLARTLKTDDAGEVTLEAAPLPAGSYRLIGKATLGERPISAEDVFLVDPEREELEHPAAREDILAGVARATGGRYLGTAAALDDNLELLPPRVVRVDRRSDIEIWSRPHLFLLALALLGTEWALRRRRGFL